jgi:hypothetical protein
MKNADTSAPPVRDDGLQLRENRALQERMWTMERVAHGLFGVAVLIGLSGLAGAGGPVAETTLTSEAGSVRLPRVARWETPQDFTIEFAESRATHVLRLAGPGMDRLIVEAMQPQPERSSAGPDSMVFEFSADDQAVARAAFRASANRPGLARLQFGLDDAAPVSATVLVLP